ncbi:methyltransferase domain-containing protein [Streptomyces sp. NPDC088794]|uniref:class I SAM-dependent methyltransferase n=1 Tax=Streptomyces sp. NPDC088794 TaxID=3365902 RepID=UPI0038127C16
MSDLHHQTAYWDAVAETKHFTHPLHTPWLDGLGRDAVILDYGCGYGRTMDALEQQGFGDLFGVDTSPGMISRARRLHPAMRFEVLDTPPTLPCPDASIDLVVLFAVLTCVPDDQAQRRLIGEVRRVLKPGGRLYLSDLLLQSDRRNRDRYTEYSERHGGPYGVFRTDDGAVCRHHPDDWFTDLLSDFTSIDTRPITVATMNGHEAAGVQILAGTPTSAPPRTVERPGPTS